MPESASRGGGDVLLPGRVSDLGGGGGVCSQGGSAPGGVSAPGGSALGGVCSWGCLLQGVSAPGGVCSGGCLLLEGVCPGGSAPGGCLLWGLPGGVSAPGVCLLPGGVCSRGVSALGVSAPGGGVCSRVCVCVSASGGCVSQHALRQTPRLWTESQTPVKNITLAQLRCGR